MLNGSEKMKEPFIIAEAGIAHNGKLSIAKQLVDVAKECDANAVKFQTFWGINRLKKYELSKKEFKELHDYCLEKDIMFLSTPHTFDAIHFLDRLVPMYKVASTYLTNANFLMEVASKNKPVLLSTGNLMRNDGMATIEEIRNAMGFIPDAEVILMHCISKYPCRDPKYHERGRLKIFGKTIGISDHSLEIRLPRAPYIEKHIRLPSTNYIDKEVSIIPQRFKKMVEYLRSE